LHLTLAFVGEVEESRAAAIASRLAVEIELPPFTVTLGSAGVFPARGAPRVLWLGVLHGLEEFTNLRELVARRLSESGVAVDRKRFSPHLTLGRWRGGEARVARRVALALDSRAERVIAQMAVNEVTVFQSRLSSAGATYTALARARLSCPSSS
jgi:2'-5' RNA ligase